MLCRAAGGGQTSFGRSIARATGRVFHRISLGGARDEADIRGHRRTYVGALPGRIIRALRTAGVNNPVLLLDEVDKLSAGLMGDPAAALLEVLDPEQNQSFVDNYLGLAFDLSNVMFICTANTTDTVPPTLLDRLEVIRLSGYSIEEKVQIARRHLLPKQMEQSGLEAGAVEVSDEVLELLAECYTRESGVRALERQIAALCRKVVRDRPGGTHAVRVLDAGEAKRLLGTPPYLPPHAGHLGRPGLCRTLALTASGAEVVVVEVLRSRGTGKLAVTGRAGETVRESAVLAYDYLRSAAGQFALTPDEIEGSDYHVHFPGPGAPAEGASVGLPMLAALVSLLHGLPLPEDAAVVGELTLKGQVLEVPDLPEKLVAAARAQLSTVVVPERNRKDLELPGHSRVPEGVSVVYCSTAAQAVHALLPSLAAPDASKTPKK